MKCEYGCDKEACYQLKNKKWCCSISPNQCDGMRLKNKQGLKKSGFNPGFNFLNTCSHVAWNKGLSKETDERVKQYSESISKNTKGENNHWFGKHMSEESKLKISKGLKKYCEDIEARKRLRDIGRKGGFGKKGYTSKGTYYTSIFEKQCFDYLEENNIKFESHKEIPNSSKVSDIYLIEKDLWIELDGINREKKKKYISKDYEYWLNKLKIYNQNNLTYKIVYNIEEFKKLFGGVPSMVMAQS